MKPAFSVIFLTTLIGAAQGLVLALFTVELCGHAGLLPTEAGDAFFTAGALVALVLAGLGLLSSFFHLGRPERAWRSAAMWRTSWLSREVIVLPAFMAAVLAYGLAHGLDATSPLAQWRTSQGMAWPLLLSALAALLALLLFVCTGMIYACLPFLAEWHSPLTVINFTLLGSASGVMLAAALSLWLAPELSRLFAVGALALTALGAIGRCASLWRNNRLRPKSTLQTAIGIKHPQISQKAAGFLGGSFNTREFFHGQTQQVLRAVKWGFLLAVFAAPIVLLAIGLGAGDLRSLPVIVVLQFAGLVAERWYFFAQARHPQNHYYHAIR